MEFIKLTVLFAVGLFTLKGVDCSQSDLDHIYFNGNGSQNVVFRSFNKRNIKFFMYNREKPNGYRLFEDAENLRNSGFDRTNPTKFLIHGYTGNYKSNSIQLPKNAYMKGGNFNIIAVDWSAYAFPYAVAVNSARDVGYAVGDIMMFMSRTGGMELSDTHVIGHSLGAHIAGYAGKRVRSRTRTTSKGRKPARMYDKVARITGLDPAAPAFTNNSPNQRLDAGDAQYVDVIHTSTRLLGLAKKVGHADFYPAGGTNQPDCPNNVMEQATGLCDHNQSYVYFARSINNRHAYPAVRCNNVQEAMKRRCSGESGAFMGEEAARSSGGVYYVYIGRPRKGKGRTKEERHSATT